MNRKGLIGVAGSGISVGKMKRVSRRGQNGGELVCKIKGSMHSEIIHFPKLDTVLMVEDTIKKLDYYPTRNQLWRALPRMVMWQTFNVIIEYLLESSKIIITRDGKIMWVTIDSNKLRKLLEKSVKWKGSR